LHPQHGRHEQETLKLLDFNYIDEDIVSLRKQMQIIVNISADSDSLSPNSMLSPLSEPDEPDGSKESPKSQRESPVQHTDDDEDRPLASRMPPPVARIGKTVSGRHAAVTSQHPSSQHSSSKMERMNPAHLERLTTGITIDTNAPSSARSEKPCVMELRQGLIRIVPVFSDGESKSLVILTGLKTLFQKQLPKMPREYISRLVYDHNSRALAIVKNGWKVVGGILFRPFAHRGFAEIVFLATASIDQIKVRYKSMGSEALDTLQYRVTAGCS
jgi:histone acetyltransferase